MTGSFRLRIGIISVVIGGHFGGGDHFDGGDHFGGGTWPFNKQDSFKKVNILDDTIIGFCPLVTKFEKQYEKKFLSTPTTNSN